MKESSRQIIKELVARYPQLAHLENAIEKAFLCVRQTYENGGTFFTCGNGGSAADSEHIVGELMKSFRKKRKVDDEILRNLRSYGVEGEEIANSLEGGLPCISLTSHVALSTAYSNDKEPQATFAQQLLNLGKAGDALLAISTSGNSKNCVYAALVAKAKGIKIVALTGEGDSKLKAIADYTVNVPEKETFKVQELHLPVYHALCAFLEEEFF